MITLGKTFTSDTLSSDQEEADTKVILHCHDALKENSNGYIILRSASGDTDILVLAVAHLYNEKQRVYIDSGCSSTSRKVYWMEDTVMSEDEINSLISFHALTGNDYVTSFFCKGKLHCWKVLEKSERFLAAIQRLGATWELPSYTFQQVQAYACVLYGNTKCKSVTDMFNKKYTQKNKVIDLSMLPPCESALMLHCKRANDVAKIWESALNPIVHAPEIYENGWTVTGDIEWVEKIFPNNVEAILMDDEYKETYDFDSKIESDSETDMI